MGIKIVRANSVIRIIPGGDQPCGLIVVKKGNIQSEEQTADKLKLIWFYTTEHKENQIFEVEQKYDFAIGKY